jgi:dTDP-4-dehydrorhamnose 3,5-epimerase-like enzyme
MTDTGTGSSQDRSSIAPIGTGIPGLTIFELAVIPDGRGWQKTAFDYGQMTELGLSADFRPTRWVINHNRHKGVTRGIHAELCNKLVSVSRGTFFSVIVDLRIGPTFGTAEQIVLTPARALFIPVGCGNSYQTQTDDAQYGYLSDEPIVGPELTAVDLADPALAISWPIPLERAIRLEDDLKRPGLRDIQPINLQRLGEIWKPATSLNWSTAIGWYVWPFDVIYVSGTSISPR